MRLTQTRTYMTMLFILLFSVVAQPVLAASISVAMQMSSPYHETVMTMQGADCQHMIMIQSHGEDKTQPEQKTSQDCLADCQFCMHIAFILPLMQPQLPGRDVTVVQVVKVQKAFGTRHLPAHEPPRFYA